MTDEDSSVEVPSDLRQMELGRGRQFRRSQIADVWNRGQSFWGC